MTEITLRHLAPSCSCVCQTKQEGGQTASESERERESGSERPLNLFIFRQLISISGRRMGRALSVSCLCDRIFSLAEIAQFARYSLARSLALLRNSSPSQLQVCLVLVSLPESERGAATSSWHTISSSLVLISYPLLYLRGASLCPPKALTP